MRVIIELLFQNLSNSHRQRVYKFTKFCCIGMKIAKQAHCLIESSLVRPKAQNRAHDLRRLVYGVITNKEKPFVIYE